MCILSPLQYHKSSDESRLTVQPFRIAKLRCEVSELPQLRDRSLLSCHLSAPDRQGQEVLVLHPLMARLDSGPLSNLGEVGAAQLHNSPRLFLFVYGTHQENMLKFEGNGN